jgi:hypothetical protein
MSLENKIIELLKVEQPLMAKEIASRFGINITVKDINSVLYKDLRGKVIQDSKYRWSINKKPSKQIIGSNEPLKLDTDLSKLASYYIECVSKDIDSGISIFSSSRKEPIDYAQLSRVPSTEPDAEKIDLESIRSLINKVRKDKNRLVLKLGYPLFLRRFISKSGNPYYKVEPLLLFNIDTDHLLKNNHLKFTDEEPEVNPEMLKNILGINGHELLLEIIELNNELGLNNTDLKPSIDELSQRLHQIRDDWEWVDEINPYSLSTVDLSQSSHHGIHNSCGVFVSERSQFTAGLEKELTDLQRLPKSAYVNSALGNWINRTIDSTANKDHTLLEPLSLNEEQREAISRGLSAPLTVVTGPPGTGKSQVVASLLINAVFKGQKVLFASKNHKAVNVVFERVNDLTTRPVMLRLGNMELQASLSSYLTELLSSKTTIDDTNRFKDLKQRHDSLSKKILAFRSEQVNIIEKRNAVDNLERTVEHIRDKYGKELFGNIKQLQYKTLVKAKTSLEDSYLKLVQADLSKQSFFVKLFWGFYKKERFVELGRAYRPFNSFTKSLKLNFPELNKYSDDTLPVIPMIYCQF